MIDTIGHHLGKVYNKAKYVCEAKPYGCFREWNKNAESCTSRKAYARVSSYREAFQWGYNSECLLGAHYYVIPLSDTWGIRR
ncbi:hypothetical protein QWA68_012053 [Fusarium oxysporum]|nr:hypothetical protein QWA68_012053 [Fusarium oxysporum]